MPMLRCDALARIRTGTPCGTAPSRQRVYQFHHQGERRKTRAPSRANQADAYLWSMELWVAFGFGGGIGILLGYLFGRQRRPPPPRAAIATPPPAPRATPPEIRHVV